MIKVCIFLAVLKTLSLVTLVFGQISYEKFICYTDFLQNKNFFVKKNLNYELIY
jgi:hypothetical protein